MRISAVSDLHITDKCPENRMDKEYLQTCYNKFENILDISDNFNAEVLIIGGDIFDYPTVPRHVVTYLLSLIQDWKRENSVKILVIAGQHDLRYHRSGLENTPLGNMIASGLVTLLQPDKPFIYKDLKFVGKSWGETVTTDGDVLVVHQMVTEKGPLWPGQTDYISAPGLLKKYPSFKYIISGDNHKPHFYEKSNIERFQINCGSMMRSSKDQTNYKPKVWLIDTEGEILTDDLCIEPAKKVFDYAKIALEETKQIARDEAQEKINTLIESFGHKKGEKVKFSTIVQDIIKQTKPHQGVVDIINGILEKVSED